jgi:methionyl-tRNA formyltransferase
MDEGLDTGDMLLTAAEAIRPEDSTATLHDRLSALGAALAVQGLRRLAAGEALPATPQPLAGVTYAHKIDKAEAAVDWTQPAAQIERRLRAFDPFPGMTATVAGQPLKLWRGRVLPGPAGAAPGQCLDLGPERLAVACGDGALELLQVQPPGGRRLAVAEYLRRRA